MPIRDGRTRVFEVCPSLNRVFFCVKVHSGKTWVTVLGFVVRDGLTKVLIGTSQLLWFVYGFETAEQQINNVQNTNNLYALKNIKRNRHIHDFVTFYAIDIFSIYPAMQLLSNQWPDGFIVSFTTRIFYNKNDDNLFQKFNSQRSL